MPGKIIAVGKPEAERVTGRLGVVDFQGSRLEVGLAFVPEARTGDWVLVHAGFALQVLDEDEARETWRYLEEIKAGDVLAGIPGDGSAETP
ncbi:MAG TPA: HypC/HybG/HupF family hydrogenase formation chaperone [Phycisphaerae bacterium]|nr:HypC/HybG/HupF family hydrogenase formation chaperone [Phycisphaerae bacterium]